jgi:ribosome modulation factor
MPEAPQPRTEASAGVSNDAILSFMHDYERQSLICDQANGERRRIIKQWKKEGVDTDAGVAACRMRKREPDAVKLYMRGLIRSLVLRHMPVEQTDLFEGWSPEVSETVQRADDVFDAGDKGYRAGRKGVDIAECPYDAGAEQQAVWIQAWHRGQAAIAHELGPDTHLASASRARPRRADQGTLPGVAAKAKRKVAAGKKAKPHKGPIRGRRRRANGHGTPMMPHGGDHSSAA